MPIGATLRDAREREGFSVEQIAERIKIRPARIVALERDDFEHLPSGFYLSALVRAYGSEVHVDPEPLIEQLHEQRGEIIEEVAGRPRRPATLTSGAFAVVAVLAVISGGNYLFEQAHAAYREATAAAVEPTIVATEVIIPAPLLTLPVSVPALTFSVDTSAALIPAEQRIVRVSAPVSPAEPAQDPVVHEAASPVETPKPGTDVQPRNPDEVATP